MSDAEIVFLTRKELAEELRIKAQSLAAMAIRGDGPPFVKVGTRLVRYRRADVDAWFAERTHSHDGMMPAD